MIFILILLPHDLAGTGDFPDPAIKTHPGLQPGIITFMTLRNDGHQADAEDADPFAGFFAICIALLPTSPADQKGDIVSILHYVTAGFFYRTTAIVMALAVIGIPLDGIGPIYDKTHYLHPTLILETIALTSFGISWLTKGEFILKDKT